MPEWLILADDLTGANDTGVMFAQRGLQTVVAITPGSMPPTTVRVISSASRALPPALAAERVRTLLADLPETDSRVYKKIDSVLRGNPAAELGALLDIRGARRALVCPALPDQQRTVRGGRVYWRGLPLDQTEFKTAIRSSELAELFAPLQNRIPLRSMTLEGLRAGEAQCAAIFARYREGLWIADAETDADLAILARAAEQAGIDILCGSAGLARSIAAGIPGTPDRSAFPRGGQPWLVVAGSRSPAAVAQVQAAVAAGAHLIAPRLSDLESANLMTTLPAGRDYILSLVQLEEHSRRVDALLGSLVVELVQSMQPGGLFLTGGDTAAMVCGWLGARLIELHNEVEPGVPWGRLLDGPYAGLAIITKAGSFGSPDLLARTLAHYRQYAKDRAQDHAPRAP